MLVRCFRKLSNGISCRSISFLTSSHSLSDKRKEFKERKLLGYTSEQVYNVVADIDKYKLFLPWCKESKIIKEGPEYSIAQLTVGFPPLGDSYKSIVYRKPNTSLRSIAVNGYLFTHLETTWTFEDGPVSHSTLVHISTIFEFRSLIYASLGLPIFDEVAKTLASSFEKRCHQLYGPDHLRTRPSKYNLNKVT